MSLKQMFGKNMRSYRFKKKYSQEKLAEKVNISVNYVSQLERGQHSADFDVIERICKCLDIKPFQLFIEGDYESLPRRFDMYKK